MAHSAGDIFWELLIDPNDLKSKVVYKVTSNEITGIVRWVTLAFQKAPGCSNFFGIWGPKIILDLFKVIFLQIVPWDSSPFFTTIWEKCFSFFQAPDKQIQDSPFFQCY